MGKQRILLVEDDARFREDFARALQRAMAAESFDVAFVEAGSLAEARERLREGGLDAALIDVRLPDGDGLDLVREIHDGGVGSLIPTLVLTAYLDHRVAAQPMDAGAKGALSKVVSVPETTEAIMRLLGAPGGMSAPLRWHSSCVLGPCSSSDYLTSGLRRSETSTPTQFREFSSRHRETLPQRM